MRTGCVYLNRNIKLDLLFQNQYTLAARAYINSFHSFRRPAFYTVYWHKYSTKSVHIFLFLRSDIVVPCTIVHIAHAAAAAQRQQTNTVSILLYLLRTHVRCTYVAIQSSSLHICLLSKHTWCSLPIYKDANEHTHKLFTPSVTQSVCQSVTYANSAKRAINGQYIGWDMYVLLCVLKPTLLLKWKACADDATAVVCVSKSMVFISFVSLPRTFFVCSVFHMRAHVINL